LRGWGGKEEGGGGLLLWGGGGEEKGGDGVNIILVISEYWHARFNASKESHLFPEKK